MGCGGRAEREGEELVGAGKYERNGTMQEDREAGGGKGGKAAPKRGRRNCSRTGKSRGRPIGWGMKDRVDDDGARQRGRASWPAVFIVSRVDSRSPALIKYLTHPRRARSVAWA